jgi:hypothetical protein
MSIPPPKNTQPPPASPLSLEPHIRSSALNDRLTMLDRSSTPALPDDGPTRMTCMNPIHVSNRIGYRAAGPDSRESRVLQPLYCKVDTYLYVSKYTHVRQTCRVRFGYVEYTGIHVLSAFCFWMVGCWQQVFLGAAVLEIFGRRCVSELWFVDDGLCQIAPLLGRPRKVG